MLDVLGLSKNLRGSPRPPTPRKIVLAGVMMLEVLWNECRGMCCLASVGWLLRVLGWCLGWLRSLWIWGRCGFRLRWVDFKQGGLGCRLPAFAVCFQSDVFPKRGFPPRVTFLHNVPSKPHIISVSKCLANPLDWDGRLFRSTPQV